MSTKNGVVTLIAVLLALDIVLRLGVSQPAAMAQHAATTPRPINLTAARTDGDNYLLYRLWSDGAIDVRLVNPLKTQAHDWPKSDRAGISFQEGWKLFQPGP